MNEKGQAWTIAIIIAATLGIILIVIYWPAVYESLTKLPKPTPLEIVKRDCATLCSQWRNGGCPHDDWNVWLIKSDCIGNVTYMNESYWCGSDPEAVDPKCGGDYVKIVHYECPCRVI